MNVFMNVVEALGLQSKHVDAVAYYGNTDNLAKTVERMGLLGFTDQGTVLDHSMAGEDAPLRFMKATDALQDHLNNNLDNVEQGPDILAALLDTEIISVDRFVPNLHVRASGLGDGSLVFSCDGVGLSLSLFSTVIVADGLNADHELADILDTESDVVFKGQLTITQDCKLHWVPVTDIVAESSLESGTTTRAFEPSLPRLEPTEAPVVGEPTLPDNVEETEEVEAHGRSHEG